MVAVYIFQDIVPGNEAIHFSIFDRNLVSNPDAKMIFQTVHDGR